MHLAGYKVGYSGFASTCLNFNSNILCKAMLINHYAWKYVFSCACSFQIRLLKLNLIKIKWN